MTPATNTLSQCCDVDAMCRGKVWCPVQRRYTKAVSTLGRDCKDCIEWPVGATNTEIPTLLEEHSRPGEVVMYTDGLVKRGVKSDWAHSAKIDGVVVAEDRTPLVWGQGHNWGTWVTYKQWICPFYFCHWLHEEAYPQFGETRLELCQEFRRMNLSASLGFSLLAMQVCLPMRRSVFRQWLKMYKVHL